MDIKTTKARLRRAKVVEVSVTGQELLEQPLLNKGTAFSEKERHELGLMGLLPPDIEDIEQQVSRCYEAFGQQTSNLAKHVYLRNLQDENETLFYRLILDHIAEMLPIIYTPVVGEACQKFSHIYRRPRGLFISYPERDHVDEILANCALPGVEVIVVTDGERILGLGDQGAGGMGIPIGKLSLYTAIGGIHPATTLPITLDVGTNNPERLSDPEYIGWRHERITGKEYDDFVETFVTAVMRAFPNVLLQFEDFASKNASPILARYRDRLCTFNDDIQGTAAVTSGTILAAVAATGRALEDQRVVMLGAGSAGIGISYQLVAAMMKEGLSEAEARSRFFVIDSHGLIHDGRTDLAPYKRAFEQKLASLSDWGIAADQEITLLDTVKNAKPSILVGVTGQPGAIGEDVVRSMAENCERPIIFPLSNPTSRCEALPKDVIDWTDGRALIATGSPFDPVPYKGREIPIAQCNNSYIFPAMGLGILAAKASRVTDEMFMAAAIALKDGSQALIDPQAPLLPRLEDLRQIARQIAIAVGAEAQKQGVAEKTTLAELEKRIDEITWSPEYLPFKRHQA
ncbi:NAD-dependent malic enzyme [Bythopirellula polymerisocia]|uniref:Malolactic enzyme n=1 Tax=Bythopirellula polymerisocia TaxID=2528003 RepID=A0A5C6D4A1_9BACT|nr:NAD-dependent malic enzyme [Bythopirellula polymerisocia]TWU29669.1 NAD-dependent malic enzyme [Bythopirellula polymerisocia]